MTNPPVTEEAVERAVDGLVQLHRKLLACFQSPTGEPPPRRPKQFEPTMKDCDAVLSAAVELERVKAALKSPPVNPDGPEAADAIERLRDALTAICNEAEHMTMTMRRRKVFDAGKAALSSNHALAMSVKSEAGQGGVG